MVDAAEFAPLALPRSGVWVALVLAAAALGVLGCSKHYPYAECDGDTVVYCHDDSDCSAAEQYADACVPTFPRGGGGPECGCYYEDCTLLGQSCVEADDTADCMDTALPCDTPNGAAEEGIACVGNQVEVAWCSSVVGYWQRRLQWPCTAGTQCFEANGRAGCVDDPAVACDPESATALQLCSADAKSILWQTCDFAGAVVSSTSETCDSTERCVVQGGQALCLLDPLETCTEASYQPSSQCEGSTRVQRACGPAGYVAETWHYCDDDACHAQAAADPYCQQPLLPLPNCQTAMLWCEGSVLHGLVCAGVGPSCTTPVYGEVDCAATSRSCVVTTEGLASCS